MSGRKLLIKTARLDMHKPEVMVSTRTCCIGSSSTKASGGRLLLAKGATTTSSEGSRLERVGSLTGATCTSSKGPAPKRWGRARAESSS